MKKYLVLAAAIGIAAPAYPADTLSFSLSHTATENLFQTRYAEADAITTAGLSWEKALSDFSLLAGIDYSLLRENTGLNLAVVSAGADYLRTLGEKTALYFSLQGNASLFRAEYSDFNHTDLRFLAAVKTYLSPSSILKASASSEVRSYRYDPFDYFSQGVSVSLDKYFPSRTTLQAEAGWGYKYFFHPQTLTASVQPSAAVGTTFAGVAVAAGQSGNGNGGQGGSGQGGYGRTGGGTTGLVPGAASLEGRGIQIASLQARIAQGLGNRIGLRLTGIIQWNLSGENPFTTVDEYAMFENPTYDAFAWEGTGWNAQISLLLPWNVDLRLAYNRTDKSFPGIESRDLEGNALGLIREDGRDQMDVKVEKSFGRLTVLLTFAFIRNTSNDPLFDWRGGLFSGGLQWNFGLGGK